MASAAPSVAPGMDLFAPVSLGDLQLANRVVMAPLTRLRSGDAAVPGELVADHYAQRASVGLIITEGTFPNAESRAYPGQPGIVTDEQVEGWRRVAEAVHARGGRIVMQVMHGGRVSHTDINGADRIVAPSAIAIRGEVRTPAGKQPYPVPHALTTEEARATLADIVAASERAVAAGLDGVEIHSANGYLLHEFLSPASNERTDVYGGSPENRARFVVEVTTAVAEAIGAGKVGIRISPEHNVQDAFEHDHADVLATYGALVDGLRPLGLAYLSVLHKAPGGDLVQELRRRFDGPADRQQRLLLAHHARRGGAADRGRPRRGRRRRPAGHRQPRPGRAVGRRAPGERPESGDLLRGRRRGLHRLPDAGGRPELTSAGDPVAGSLAAWKSFGAHGDGRNFSTCDGERNGTVRRMFPAPGARRGARRSGAAEVRTRG